MLYPDLHLQLLLSFQLVLQRPLEVLVPALVRGHLWSEELVGVPYRYHRAFLESTVIHPDGSRTPSRAVEYIRREGCHCDFAQMEVVFAAEDLFAETRIGEARVMAMPLRTIVDRTVALLEKDREALLESAVNL